MPCLSGPRRLARGSTNEWGERITVPGCFSRAGSRAPALFPSSFALLASEFPRIVFAGNSSRCIKKYANKGYDSSAASQRPFSAAVCPLSFRDRHYRHLGLLPFVTRAEYSCKVLHKRSRAGFRELHHFGFSVIISLGWRQANEEEVWTSSTSSF